LVAASNPARKTLHTRVRVATNTTWWQLSFFRLLLLPLLLKDISGRVPMGATWSYCSSLEHHTIEVLITFFEPPSPHQSVIHFVAGQYCFALLLAMQVL